MPNKTNSPTNIITNEEVVFIDLFDFCHILTQTCSKREVSSISKILENPFQGFTAYFFQLL